jgi:hypothetical protein
VRQRIQVISLRQEGGPAEDCRVNRSMNSAHMANEGGWRTVAQNMTSEEEKTFLARFTEAAGAGVPVNVAELKSPYEEETRKPTGGFSVQANNIPKIG